MRFVERTLQNTVRISFENRRFVMLRKFIIVFCAINLLTVSATVFVRCSKSASRNLASTVFSINRNPRVVSADVLGYTFEINRHRNSPSTTSYFYAVAYRFADENYFAVVKIADSVKFGDNEHLPLPKQIEVEIDEDDPKIAFLSRKASFYFGGFLVHANLFCCSVYTVVIRFKNRFGKIRTRRMEQIKGFYRKNQISDCPPDASDSVIIFYQRNQIHRVFVGCR